MLPEIFKAPFKGRSLLNWIDNTPQEILQILDLADQVKAESRRDSSEIQRQNHCPYF